MTNNENAAIDNTANDDDLAEKAANDVAEHFSKIAKEAFGIIMKSATPNSGPKVKDLQGMLEKTGLLTPGKSENDGILRAILRVGEDRGVIFVARGVHGGVHLGKAPQPNQKRLTAEAKKKEIHQLQVNALQQQLAQLREEQMKLEAEKNIKNDDEEDIQEESEDLV